MELEARKLDLIQYLVQLTDETVFNTIEAAVLDITANLRNASYAALDGETQPATVPAGRIMTLDELESEVENW